MNTDVASSSSSLQTIGVRDLHEILLLRDGVRKGFIDIRSAGAFREKHIEGTINIPFERYVEIQDRLREWERLYVIDENGSWSFSFCHHLQHSLHVSQPIVIVEGGIIAWERANLPLSKPKQQFRSRRLLLFALSVAGAAILLIGHWTNKNLCCRLTRGAIGSMECHWYVERPTSAAGTLFTSDWNDLHAVKIDRLRCTQDTSRAFDKLYSDAENLLIRKPVSVMDKELLPPSGDKHDFLSLSRYFWPNTKTANGLPYTRRDGETNPDIYSKKYDKQAMEEMIDRVRLLTFAFFLFEDERFAQKAAEQLRMWFVDEETKMSPHLRFAGLIPGQEPGRGLVPLHELPDLLDASTILLTSDAWSTEDQKQFRTWVSDYYDWITKDEEGLADKALRNNRGTWYEVQAAAMEIFLEKTEEAKIRVITANQRRLPIQFAGDGGQPLEVARTKPWLYSTYNLKAWMDLADMARIVGVDTWHLETKDGKSLRKALDHLLPYVFEGKEWPHRDFVDEAYLYPLLRRAAREFPDAGYDANLRTLEKKFDLLESLATLRWPTD